MLADDCIGPVVAQKVAALRDGEVGAVLLTQLKNHVLVCYDLQRE